MVIAGIDPGFSGAIAVFDGLDFPEIIDMPIVSTGKRDDLNMSAIASLLQRNCVTHVFLEHAQSMPGQGIASTGRYLESFGMLRGLIFGMGIPYTLVRPNIWKKAIGVGKDGGKGASVVRVEQLFPHIHLPRKKDHGKADAILISEWGRRQMKWQP